MDKLHVLIIPTWYPIGEDKLMGIYHKDFCNALNKRKDIKSNILYIQRKRLKKPWEYVMDKKWKVIDEGTYHTYIKTMLNVGPISKELQLKEYTKALDKAFKKYIKINGKPDILHAQVIVPAGYAAAVLSKKYNIPLVITEHTAFTARDRFKYEPYKKYAEFAYSNSIYTAVSKRVIDEINRPDLNIGILPNSVNLDIFRKSEKEKNDNNLNLITVCALRPEKGIDYEIEAINILKEEYKVKDIKLTIVGSGDQMGYYKELVDKFNLNDNIVFVGRKDRKEVASYLSKSDIFVLPSEFETFGIPPIEAMAVGLPIVSTKCGAPEEYMDSKCGELCDIKDAKSLADSIYKVYKKIETYDSSYLKSVANRFSDEEVTNKAVEIYKGLLNR